MRKVWIWLATGLFAFGSVHAEYRPPIFDFEVGVGYRQDHFKMKMQGFKRNSTTNFTTPTKELWKMTWSEIQIVESSATLRYTSCLNYYIRLDADWGRIHNGEGHIDGYALLPGRVKKIDIDSTSSPSSAFDEIRHFQHFSRIKGKANRGSVMDFEGGVGYQLRSNGRRCIITPLAGWSYHEQRLELHHGRQAIDVFDPFPVLGDIPDFHFLYKPSWHGPWIGADIEVQVDIPCVLLFGTMEYHWAQFESSAEWNFADAYINKFYQHSHGHGMILHGGISQKLECNLWITAFGTYRNWQAKRGRQKTTRYVNHLLFKHQVFGTYPVFDVHKDTDVEKCRWTSWVAGIAFDYRF